MASGRREAGKSNPQVSTFLKRLSHHVMTQSNFGLHFKAAVLLLVVCFDLALLEV
jgi:hypothetical protein